MALFGWLAVEVGRCSSSMAFYIQDIILCAIRFRKGANRFREYIQMRSQALCAGHFTLTNNVVFVILSNPQLNFQDILYADGVDDNSNQRRRYDSSVHVRDLEL